MYIKKTTFTFLLAVILLLAVVSVWPVLAGNIDSPGAPGSTSSYTLQDIYARLTSGTAGSQSTFTEPVSGPGSTMADLNTIMAVDAANGAAAADVASGKTFWGLLPGGDWGPQTGTAASAGANPYVWIPRTGQTTCYSGATAIPCAGTGQDGAYQTGSTLTPPQAPASGTTGTYTLPWLGTARFTDNGDGTVTDDLTGLIWLKDANCFGAKQWTQALSDANGLASGACGLSDGSNVGDWRLPNVNELHSLIDLSQSNPALPSGHPFTSVQNLYWSSTPIVEVASFPNSWYVRMNDGYVTNTTRSFGMSVWPVRGGQ